MWRSSRRRKSSRRPPRVAGLLALASTSSALSLANFQLITSNTIPSACILAYNTQISGCTTSDFTDGNQCSTLCQDGLLEEATIVQAICGGLSVNAQSLLGLLLNGSILDTLCPGSSGGTTTVKVTVQPSTTSKSVSTTSILSQTTTTTSPSVVFVTTTVSSSATTSSSAIINAPSQTTTTGTTSALIETSVTATTTDAAQTTQATSTTIESTSTDSTSTTQQAGATQGGGSPFDAVIQNQAVGLTSLGTAKALLAVLGVAVFWM